MADVQPLRGLRYASEVVGNPGQVVTPPFDVISPEAQARYYARSPYNVIRLELGLEFPNDTSINNRYTRAAATLAEWRINGVLRQEAIPSYYLYQQIFPYQGQPRTRTSLLARVRLEPWDARVVLRHEYTRKKDKDDRLQLLRACSTNFSPIMSMYDDPQGRVRRLLAQYTAQPEVQIIDEAQEGHRLQPITDPGQIALIHDFFSERQLYIADGHHRYETALNYREEVRATRGKMDEADAVNFVLMALIDLDDPGLVVFPTHRLLFGLDQEKLDRLANQAFAHSFTVREMDATNQTSLLQALEEAGKAEPSLLVSMPGQAWLLSLNEQGRARMARSGHSAAWNELDVSIAHLLVLEDILEIDTEDPPAPPHVHFTHDTDEAAQAVRTGRAQAALLLNATRVRQVCDVALADDRMPQKSTYFYPKLITGLVMNPLW